MADLQVAIIDDQGVLQLAVDAPQETQVAVALPGVQGASGPAGPAGPAGSGVPSGGATNDVLVKQSNANYDTTWTSTPTLSGLNVSGTVYIQGTDVGGYINGLKLPDFNEVYIVYSGGLITSASYPSGTPYDYIGVTYSGVSDISGIDYKLGGSSGTTIASYVITYSGGDVASVVRTV